MSGFHIDMLPENPRILIIKLRSIGDLIYNTAIYGPLKKQLPNANVTLVVEPFARDIVKDNPYIDEILSFDKSSLFTQLAFYVKLLLTRYDLVIDMHGGPRSALMALLTGSKYRVGNILSKRSSLYTVKLDFDSSAYLTPLSNQTAFMTEIGIPVENPKPELYFSKEVLEETKRLLGEKGIDESTPYCILHIGYKKKCHDWKEENYAAVIDFCWDKYRLPVVITTIARKMDTVKRIVQHVRNSQYHILLTGLQVASALAKSAEFVVSHDGGYVHISAAVGTPVIAMFGPTNIKWMPQDKRHKVVYKALSCSPCGETIRQQPGKEECNRGNAECMRSITVEDVTKEIDEVMVDK